MKNIGKPCAGKLHARFDEGGQDEACSLLYQKQLADLIGIAQHHISEMENGKRPIGKEMANKLATALNVDYRVFL